MHFISKHYQYMAFGAAVAVNGSLAIYELS